MVRFTDGPAAGVVLDLRRAPLLLRAVVSPHGTWDALDQLGDAPQPREKAFVYLRTTPQRFIFLRPGGRYAMAEYRLYAEQPAAVTTRDTARWRAWCESEWDRIRAQAAT